MRLKKIICGCLCIALLLISGCAPKTPPDKELIATSFYPIYIFTINLTDGIDELDVQCMAEQNTGCLHDYNITTKDARLLNDCDVFIINGAGMEGFVEDLYLSVENLNIVDSSVGVELLCGEEHHEGEQEHHHHENSHIWMSVKNARIQVENISRGLINAFPQYEKEIMENTVEYLNRLSVLQDKISAVSYIVNGKNVVAFHNAYEYLANDMGFNVLHTIESDENGEPSAKKLSFLTKEIKENNITALFIEPEYSGSAANILKNETGVEIYTLNPVLKGEYVKTAYEDIMKQNTEIILKAVK